MTDNTQELDEMLFKLRTTRDVELNDNRWGQEFVYTLNIAKQALLDWHNKQVEEMLDRLLEHGEDFTTFGDTGRSIAVEYIEAERTRLRGEDK